MSPHLQLSYYNRSAPISNMQVNNMGGCKNSNKSYSVFDNANSPFKIVSDLFTLLQAFRK